MTENKPARRYKYGFSPCYMNAEMDKFVHKLIPTLLRKLADRLERTSPRWGLSAQLTARRNALTTTITDWQIKESLGGHVGKRSYLCTWANGVCQRFSADTARDARRIAIEWAVRFEMSPARNADPLFITWDRETQHG
jgi:hypothetical protein